MKKIYFFIVYLLVISNNGYGQNKNSEKIIVNYFVSEIEIDNTNRDDTSFFYSILRDLNKEIKTNKLVAYEKVNEGYYANPTFIKMIPNQLYSMIFGADTIQMTRPYPPYATIDTIIYHTFDYSSVKKLKLLEEWVYDTKTTTLTKKVLAYCPVMKAYSKSEVLGYYNLFWIKPEKKTLKAKDKNIELIKESRVQTIFDLQYNNYETDLTAKEVMYELRMNAYQNNISFHLYSTILNSIFANIKNKTTNVYSVDNNSTLLTYNDAINIIEPQVSLQLIRPYPPYDIYDTVVNIPVNYEEVVSFKFTEKLTYNFTTNMIEKKVISYCPIRKVYSSQTGDWLGLIDMFWIKN